MGAPALALAVGGALLLIGLLGHRIAIAPMSRLPGPWYTRLTSLVLVYHEFHGRKRTWIHDLHLRYGPVVRLGPHEASFASAAALKEIYVNSGGFEKTELYSLFEQGGHRNLFTALGKDEHKEKKKRLADRYSNSSILSGPLPGVIQDRADTFARVAEQASSTDVYFLLHCYALDCVTAACFHPHGTRSIEGTDADLVRALSYHDSRRALVLRHYAPRLAALYQWLVAPRLKGVSGESNRLTEYAWHWCTPQNVADKNVAPTTLAARLHDFPDDELTPADRVAECLDHIGAGIDTTGDTLCFLLYTLSLPENAERQARLQKELASREADPETPLFLEAVIQEALRLWAPGTLPLPRYVPAGGRTIDGYRVPAGTVVSCQSYTLHRLNADVFPEPDAFMPERWLAADSNRDAAAARNRHMFAFGAGSRVCIGKHLAMAEMRALLRSVYARYRTSVAGDMHYSMELADQLLTSRPQDMCCKLSFTAVE